MHGYKSGAERDFCGGAQIAVQGGYHVLLVDQRALFGDDPALRLDLAFDTRRRLTFGDAARPRYRRRSPGRRRIEEGERLAQAFERQRVLGPCLRYDENGREADGGRAQAAQSGGG